MKKILSLILCMIFVFSLTACKKEEEKPTVPTTKHAVDVKKYVDAGEFDISEYKLGADIEQTREKLNQITDDHGHSSFLEKADEKYVKMSAGEVFCRYEVGKEDDGICAIAINSGAFGFEKGMIPTKVSDGMATLGYNASIREIKDDENFFMPKGATADVLEYNFGKHKLLFVFVNDGLSFTVIYE